MAIRSKTQLKTFFETGDVPTEEQFGDLIDSLELVNEPAKNSSSNTLTFQNATHGTISGTWTSPLTGDIIIDDSQAVEGGVECVIWSGSTNPNIVGGAINAIAGNISEQGVYSIYFHRIAGRYNVNIFFNYEEDTQAPAAPTLLTVGDLDGQAPAIPSLLSVIPQ